MPRKRIEAKATIGFVEQGNSVIAVTISAAQVVLDRRLIALTHGLPTHPYHHEGAWALGRYLDSPWAQPTSLPAAMALIKEVTEAAHHGAHAALARLARDISVPIGQVAIRALPPLPATIEERVRDHRAQLVADSAMYREAVATAATARGWTVCWYEKEQVPRDLANALGVKDLRRFSRHLVVPSARHGGRRTNSLRLPLYPSFGANNNRPHPAAAAGRAQVSGAGTQSSGNMSKANVSR